MMTLLLPRSGPALAGAIALLLAGACGDEIHGPVDKGDNGGDADPVGPSTELLASLIVSNPSTAAPAGTSAIVSGFSGSGGIVYTSLPSGTFPAGDSAVIRTRATGAETTAVIVDGGFDPIPVAATVGDTLDVRIEVSAGEPHEYISIVPERRPPVVVRTEPPPRRRDVPLNAVMLAVFSEPISAPSLTASSVRLLLGDSPVGGTTGFGDAEHLTVTFTPDEPLAPGADYALFVTQGVLDLDGDALADELRVDFTTVAADEASASGAVFEQISAGFSYTCGVTRTNDGYCWGNNWNGQLGTGWSNNLKWRPVAIDGGHAFLQVDASKEYTCAAGTDGLAYCWGSNAGLLTDPNSAPTPVPVDGGFSFAQVSTGAGHGCGITPENAAYCWGHNDYGQLGDGTTDYAPAPRPVAGGLSFASVSAGGAHTCGVTTEGTAYCWGWNVVGHLGDGTTDDRLIPTRVAGNLSFTQVSAGVSTCGVTTDHIAYCWGSNAYGQLGDGTTDDRFAPTPVAGGLGFAQVNTTFFHTCGVTTDHAAFCWGLNEHGQLGDGTTDHHVLPVPVTGSLSLDRVAVGGGHTCGLTTDDLAYCWGWNGAGQLGSRFGYGTSGNRLAPTPVEPF